MKTARSKPQGKVETPKVQFGVAMMLTRLLPGFKTPTYADMKLIDHVLTAIQQVDQSSHIKDVFRKYEISEEDSIDPSHPAFMKINNEIMQGQSSVTKADIAVFDSEHFNSLTDGLNVNYGERKLLEFWLVKA